MNDFGKRLYDLRKNKKLARDALGAKIGVSKTAIKNWEDGENMPKLEYLQNLAKFFNVSQIWLATGEGAMTTKPSFDELKNSVKAIENRHKAELESSNFLSLANPVPVISWVVAGSWSSSEVVEWLDDGTEYLPRPANLSVQGFCLKVRGMSMFPEFRPDEVIFVEPQISVWDLKNGDLVVVRENGNQEATFKQLIIGETSNDMYLKPLNPEWHEQKMVPKSDWTLIGKVVGKWVKY